MILAGGGVLERRKDVGREHVSTDHRKPGRRGCGGRFLHEVKDSMQTRGHALSGDDPVLAHRARVHLLHAEHRPVAGVVHLNELGQCRDGRIDHLIAQNDGKGFVSDEVLGA